MKKISYLLIMILSLLCAMTPLSSLSLLGGAVSSPGFALPDLEAAGGEIYVAYKDFGSYPPGQDYVIVRTYKGSGWVDVGTPRLIPGISALSLKKTGNLYLTYIDVNGSLLIQQKATGVDWSFFSAADGSTPVPIAKAEHLCHLSAVTEASGGLKMALAIKMKQQKGAVLEYMTTPPKPGAFWEELLSPPPLPNG